MSAQYVVLRHAHQRQNGLQPDNPRNTWTKTPESKMQCATLQHRRVPEITSSIRWHSLPPGASQEISCVAWGFPCEASSSGAVYQARNDIHLAVELVLGAAVRLCHPGILLYPAYAVLYCHPDAAYLLVVLLLLICQLSGLLLPFSFLGLLCGMITFAPRRSFCIP